MMKHAALLFVCAPLVACTTTSPEGAPPLPAVERGGQCDPQPASGLVGQMATTETGARAVALTGAGRLRWGPPRSAFTMDYRADRVNVIYDDAMQITEITCG